MEWKDSITDSDVSRILSARQLVTMSYNILKVGESKRATCCTWGMIAGNRVPNNKFFVVYLNKFVVLLLFTLSKLLLVLGSLLFQLFTGTLRQLGAVGRVGGKAGIIILAELALVIRG